MPDAKCVWRHCREKLPKPKGAEFTEGSKKQQTRLAQIFAADEYHWWYLHVDDAYVAAPDTDGTSETSPKAPEPEGDAGNWLRYADEPDLPEGTSVDGCASHYQLIGKSDIESEGHLIMRYLPCYCSACAVARYDSCEVKDLVGEFTQRTAVPGSASALSALRLADCAEFALKVKTGTLVAIRGVPDRRRPIGPPYWLAEARSAPYKAKKQFRSVGNLITKGEWAFKLRWFKRVPNESRVYVATKEDITVPFCSVLFLDGLKFERTTGRGNSVKHFLAEQTHALICDQNFSRFRLAHE